jgi:hypothetical protein
MYTLQHRTYLFVRSGLSEKCFLGMLSPCVSTYSVDPHITMSSFHGACPQQIFIFLGRYYCQRLMAR